MTEPQVGAPAELRIPSAAQSEYQSEFQALGHAIEACAGRAEDVALLLSTCRNQWMTANAIFADLQPVLSTGGRSTGEHGDLVARADTHPLAYELARLRDGGDVATVVSRLGEMANLLSQARGKFRVWDDRDKLMTEFSEAIQRIDGAEAGRVLRIVAAQRRLQRDEQGRAVGEYIALSQAETSDGRRLLDELRRAQEQLAGAVHAALQVALYEQTRVERAAALEALGQREATLLDEQDPPPKAPDDPWPVFLTDLATPRSSGGSTALEIVGVEVPKESEDVDDTARANFAQAVADSAVVVADHVREGLAKSLRPNRPRPPLPSPYLIDVTPPPPPPGDRATSFSVMPYSGRTPEPPTTARMGLLRVGIPKDAYSEGALYRYRRDDGDHVRRAAGIAHAALEAAKDNDVAVVAMPECFLPAEVVDDLHDAAEDRGITLVAGVEHRADPDGRANNSAVITIPGLDQIIQRKQRPSVYEVRQFAFAADETVRVVERTPVGTLGVVICSDYLELDQFWVLTSHEPRIDTLVICARNPNPSVFDRVAAGDALRLHANIVIVNASPDDGDTAASGDGTGIFWPGRNVPALVETTRLALEAEGWPDQEAPSLAIFELTVAGLSGRRKGRTEAGLCAAPVFVTQDH